MILEFVSLFLPLFPAPEFALLHKFKQCIASTVTTLLFT